MDITMIIVGAINKHIMTPNEHSLLLHHQFHTNHEKSLQLHKDHLILTFFPVFH